MLNEVKPVNALPEYLQFSSVLAKIPEIELKRLLNSIEALQSDLSQFVPLLEQAEAIEVVTATQVLLKTLKDEINRVFAAKQTKDVQWRVQNWDNEAGTIDYTLVYSWLSKVNLGKRCLIWTDIGR